MPRACVKVASDLGLGGAFTEYSGFPHDSQPTSYN